MNWLVVDDNGRPFVLGEECTLGRLLQLEHRKEFMKKKKLDKLIKEFKEEINSRLESIKREIVSENILGRLLQLEHRKEFMKKKKLDKLIKEFKEEINSRLESIKREIVSENILGRLLQLQLEQELSKHVNITDRKLSQHEQRF